MALGPGGALQYFFDLVVDKACGHEKINSSLVWMEGKEGFGKLGTPEMMGGSPMVRRVVGVKR